MTKQELVNLLQGGKVLACGEYRSMRVETTSVMDKVSGQKQDKTIVQHMLEIGGRPGVATQWLNGHVAPPAPANKGEMVIINLTGLEFAKGHLNLKVQDGAIQNVQFS